MSRMLRGVVGTATVVGLSLGTVGTAGADPGEVKTWIVDLHDRYQPRDEAPRLARQYGGSVRYVYEHVLGGFAFRGTERAAANLARNPRISSVIADQPVAAVAETLPTGVNRIDADVAHTVVGGGHTGSGVNVAILDTGIDLDHPDLRVHTTLGVNCIDSSEQPDDGHGHGTHVAGTVAAKASDVGVIGAAHGATVVPVKVLDDSGSGSWTSVICGINHVTGKGSEIKVANMSLGGAGSAGSCDSGLRKAICDSVAAGVTYTVAAGNDSRDASGFVPAAFPEVITVSAFSDLDGTLADTGCLGFGRFKDCDEDFASFSNYGSIVDVIAPGVRIYSTDKGKTYSTKSGTSMAAPHVAGVAALVLAVNPSLTPAALEAHLKATGECPDQNPDTGIATCSDQDTWNGDPDGFPEPLVNAHWAATTTPGSGGGGGGGGEEPPSAGFTLTAAGYKVKGTKHVDLTWDGAGGTSVDVYRNGDQAATTPNDGAHTDVLGKGGGSYTYRVCEAGTETCSNEVTVTF